MRLFLLSIVLAFIAACSDSSGDVTEPLPGTLAISTITSGPQPDQDGYSITVDGVDQGTIGINATRRIEQIDPGDHAVQLNDVASDCTVSGPNPQTVTITSGGVTPLTFQLTCLPTTGGLSVTTETSGLNRDPDGYIVEIDDQQGLRIGNNETLTFSGLSFGVHTVGLSDITDNCNLLQANPLTITIAGGSTRNVTFTITCS